MRYRCFAWLIALEVVVLVFLVTAGKFAVDRAAPVRQCNRQLVQAFELTDLSIWTGARYTRHPSQADVFSAFQDGMGALERFPEGVLAPLPAPGRLPSSSAQREQGNDPTS